MNSSRVPKVAIIILNWNSWRDTIECLDTVFKLLYPAFNVILIDNHSKDESIEKITGWINDHPMSHFILEKLDELYPEIHKSSNIFRYKNNDRLLETRKLSLDSMKNLFLLNNENSGFAVANNIGMRIAKHVYSSDYYFLLNNDTIIDSEALLYLVNVMDENPSVGAAQSVIYHYDKPDRIANAGGKLLWWGQTRYYHKIGKSDFRKISFINGCALCIRKEIVDLYGGLSGKFFFGEEDFELSMRLKKKKVALACATKSKVYHKIGNSTKTNLEGQIEKKVFLFIVNRVVDMRSFYPNWIWEIWRVLIMLYFGYLLIIKYERPWRKMKYVTRKAYHLSGKIRRVDRNLVENILSGTQL